MFLSVCLGGREGRQEGSEVVDGLLQPASGPGDGPSGRRAPRQEEAEEGHLGGGSQDEAIGEAAARRPRPSCVMLHLAEGSYYVTWLIHMLFDMVVVCWLPFGIPVLYVRWAVR